MTSEPTSLGSRAAGPPNRLGEVLRIFLRL